MSLLDELKTLVNNRTDENSALYSEVKKQLGVPMLGLRTSTLGGKDRPSLNINLSLEAKETWKNGIFQNSSYAQFMISHDGSMELISTGSGMPKFRKAKIKSIGDAFAKIKKYVEAAKNADTANADTVDEAKIAPLDNVTMSDLVLFMDNESTIHDAANQYLKGLKRYLKRGKFDENRALDGWVNIVKMAAAKYNKEFGSSIRMGGEDALKIAKAYVKNNKEWIDDALADTANADTAAYPKADSDYFTIWVQEDDKQYGVEGGFRKLSEAKDEWQDVRDHYKRVRIVKFKYSTNPRDKSVYAAISELLADADTRKLPLSKVLSYGYADKASDTAASVNYVIMMYGMDNKSGSKMPAWMYGGCKDSEAAAVAFADKVSGYYPVLVKVAMKPDKKHEGALVRAFNKSGTKPISTLRTFAVVNGKIQKVTDTADTAKMPQGTEHYLMYKTHDGPVCYDAYSSMKDVNKNRKGAAALSTDGQSYVVQAKSVNEAKRKMSGGDDTASLTPASGAFGIAGVSFPMHSANAAIMIGKREADYLVKAASEAGMEAYMVVTPQKNKPNWEPLVSCIAVPRGVKSVASNIRVTFSEHGPLEIYNTTTNRTLKGFKHGQVINVAGWEAKKTKVAEIFDSMTANADTAAFRGFTDVKGSDEHLTYAEGLTFEFKAKAKVVSDGGVDRYYYVMPKELKTGNVDMSAFRKSKAWGPFANSNVFEQMIMPLVHRQGKKSWSAKTEQRIIYTDSLPTGCVVNKGKLLDTITLRIPDNYRLGKSSDTANADKAAATAWKEGIFRYQDGGYAFGFMKGDIALKKNEIAKVIVAEAKKRKLGNWKVSDIAFGTLMKRKDNPDQIVATFFANAPDALGKEIINQIESGKTERKRMLRSLRKSDTAALEWTKGLSKHPSSGGYVFGLENSAIAINKGTIATLVVIEAKSKFGMTIEPSQVSIGIIAKMKDDPSKARAYVGINAKGAKGKPTATGILA